MADPLCVLVGLGDQVQPKHLEQMRAAAPGARVVQETDPERQLTLAPQVDVFVGSPKPAFIERAAHLKWVQLGSAGVDRFVDDRRLSERGVLLTSASGVFGPCIAEHVMGLLIAFTRRLHISIRHQVQRQWVRPEGIAELAGRTLLILGFGDIGREVAIRARPFGLRVIAIKRRPGPKPPGVDQIAGPDELDALLPQADIMVMSLPLTERTRGLMDEARLRRLPQGAVLVNVGRGATVDEDALVRVLASGHLRGAGLDVFAHEPLSETSPLWDLPNVIITPHVSGHTPRYRERFCEIVCENLRRYLAGEPMRNVVDREQGY